MLDFSLRSPFTTDHTNIYTAETPEGSVRLDKSRGLSLWDEGLDSGTDDVTYVTPEQISALLKIEEMIESVPPAVLPIIALELDEIVRHETEVWLARQRASEPHGGVVLRGRFVD